MDSGLEDLLRAAGLAPKRIEAAGEIAFLLDRIPPALSTRGISQLRGPFVITRGSLEHVLAAVSPGAQVLESGTLSLAGIELPLYRCGARVTVRPHGKKIKEPRGNLKRRASWFQKRAT